MKTANVAIFVPHKGCPHRCAFCDQRRIAGTAEPVDEGTVERILTGAAENLGERMQKRGEKIDAQIAFFGGSFTAIPREEMLRLLEAAQPFLETGVFQGIRVSTRPDAVDREVLALLRERGVVAVELGAQSMDDGVLAASGRGHSAGDVVRASHLIREAGLSLGLQMMTGLPGDSGEKAISTGEALAALRPDTVRIYPALVLAHTSLAALWRRGAYRPQTLDEAVDLCARLLAFFTRRGIPVIKLGLHDGADLRESILAGPWHPAFRELCEGRVLLDRAKAALAGWPSGRVRLRVSRGSASKMAGQRRRNLRALEAMGYRAAIREADEIPYLEVRAERF